MRLRHVYRPGTEAVLRTAAQESIHARRLEAEADKIESEPHADFEALPRRLREMGRRLRDSGIAGRRDQAAFARRRAAALRHWAVNGGDLTAIDPMFGA